MVRRVVGVSSAPTPDFSPFRAVTPAAGMTDFYSQPKAFRIPESEFSQVASALQSISPTLSKVVGDQAETENQAQADQGRIDAEKLSPEQAREAMRGDFTKMEKSGVIPMGASPFRLAAMQAALGKRVVQNDLRRVLNENINRFADPYSEEDPSEFVHQQFTEMTQGMGFYAQGAATEALSQVESTFLNRASLMKSENRSEQNRKDLTSDTFNSLRLSSPPNMNEAQAMQYHRGQIQQMVDDYYKTTGESGRTQVLMGVKAAAKYFAKDGDLERAEALIDAVEGVKIGGQAIIESEAIAFQNLREEVGDLAERSETAEAQKITRQGTLRRAASEEVRLLFQGRLKSDQLQQADFDDPEFRKQIDEELAERGLEGEELEAARGAVIAGLQTAQRAIPIDGETLAKITTAISDPTTTVEANEQLLKDYADQMSGETLLKVQGLINAKRNKSTNVNRLLNESRPFEKNASDSIALALNNARMDDQALQVMNEFNLQVRQLRDGIAAKVAAGTITPDQMFNEFSTGLATLQASFEKDISQDRNKDIRDDTRPAIRKAIEDQRLQEAKSSIGGEEPPIPQDLRAETALLRIDSDATINLQTLQDKEASPKDKDEARRTIYSDALKALKDIEDKSKGRTQTIGSLGGRMGVTTITTPPGVLRPKEEIRFRMVAGFTLDEIKNKKTALGTDIPEDLLDPRHVIMFPGMETLQAFDAFVKDPANTEAILEVMRSLPEKFQFGTDQDDFKRFVRSQRSLFDRYRPSSQNQKAK